MKRIIVTLSIALMSLQSWSTSYQTFNNYFEETREAIKAGNTVNGEETTLVAQKIVAIIDRLVAEEDDFDWLLEYSERDNDQRWLFEDFDWILDGESHLTPNTQTEDVALNVAFTSFYQENQAGVHYFVDELFANTSEEFQAHKLKVRNFFRIFGYALSEELIGDIVVSDTEDRRQRFSQAVIKGIQSAAEVSEWQGNHTDSYDYSAPEKLIWVYALSTPQFKAYYRAEHLSDADQEIMTVRTLGPDEAWQQPLDIIAEVVRRRDHKKNPLYKKIDPRDYFFYIQDHYARKFGADDVNDQVEFSAGFGSEDGDVRYVITVCNGTSMWFNNGNSANSNSSLDILSIVQTWEQYQEASELRCGEKRFNIETSSDSMQANAPTPSIVRIDPELHSDGFNIVLSYIYFSNLPEEVVQRLILAMTERAGFRYEGEVSITDSKAALINALKTADMFYRIGHVQGNNLNISYTIGRELHFTKEHQYRDGQSVTLNWKIQIPMPEHNGSTSLSRTELSEVLWERSQNGRTQSLYAQGIACRSASYINTWMDAYFQAVIDHSSELNIDENGNISDFDPPFVIGATNTFNSGTHREDQAGLESYLQIILISMAHAIDPTEAFDDQEILREHMYRALAENSTPYEAESNHNLEHTRRMTHRIQIVISNEEESIDRVF